MKLKCDDGVVRDFYPAKISHITGQYMEGKCAECGELFGANDTHILKPRFKKHACANPEK
jgi:hypothetical protein